MSPRREEQSLGDAEVPRDMEWARSHRLDDWMARMESKIDKLSTDMAELKAMRSQVEDHQERIYGNGQPGLIKDVDRLKQWRKSIFWWIGVAVSAPVIAEVVKVVVSK